MAFVENESDTSVVISASGKAAGSSHTLKLESFTASLSGTVLYTDTVTFTIATEMTRVGEIPTDIEVQTGKSTTETMDHISAQG